MSSLHHESIKSLFIKAHSKIHIHTPYTPVYRWLLVMIKTIYLFQCIQWYSLLFVTTQCILQEANWNEARGGYLSNWAPAWSAHVKPASDCDYFLDIRRHRWFQNGPGIHLQTRSRHRGNSPKYYYCQVENIRNVVINMAHVPCKLLQYYTISPADRDKINRS